MTRIISGKMQECSWKMLLTAWWWWWRRWRVRRPVSKPRPPPTPSLYSFFIVIVLLDLLTSGHHLLSRVLYIKSVLHHFSIVSWCILLLIIFINSSVFTPCCLFKRVPSPVYSFTLFKWLAKSCLSFSLFLFSSLSLSLFSLRMISHFPAAFESTAGSWSDLKTNSSYSTLLILNQPWIPCESQKRFQIQAWSCWTSEKATFSLQRQQLVLKKKPDSPLKYNQKLTSFMNTFTVELFSFSSWSLAVSLFISSLASLLFQLLLLFLPFSLFFIFFQHQNEKHVVM